MDNVSGALETIFEDPTKFETIASKFDDEIDCYETLLKKAKKSLSSFNELHHFYSIAIQEGPTESVLHDLDRNAARSLKNMVLGSSRSGRQFPIDSVEELQYRVDKYQALGEEVVTPESVVFTILEYLFDKDEHTAQAYERFRLLLNNTSETDSSQNSELVTLLARSRFILAADMLSHKKRQLEPYIKEFLNDVPDPLPDDDRTATELLESAREKRYANPQKIDLVQSSLARQQDHETLVEYLYLSARDVPERYRHDSRDDPWRGELQLTRLQFQCLLNTFSESISERRETRLRSYRHLVIAEIKSGGRWRSQRAPEQLPEPNFLQASDRYSQATEKIWSVDQERGIKYLSKVFRQQAKGVQARGWGDADGWLQTIAIHSAAKQLLTNITPGDASDDLLQTVTETNILHTFLEHQAKAVVGFEQGKINQISKNVEAAREFVKPAPVYVDTSLLKDLESLHEALQLEQDGMYSEALHTYNKADNNKLDIQNRIKVVEIKQDVLNGDFDSAIENAESHFENTPILTIVELAAGRSPSSTSIKPPVFEHLSAVDPSTKWIFTHSADILSNINQESLRFSEQATEILLEL